jgi:cell division protein FtsB
MPGNRRRHANVVPLTALLTWVVIALFVMGGGLYYVYCKNQLHKSGGDIRKLEAELLELRNQNEVVKSRIATASSPNVLRKRRELDRNFLPGFSEITREHLIVINDKTPLGELRPVSNSAP